MISSSSTLQSLRIFAASPRGAVLDRVMLRNRHAVMDIPWNFSRLVLYKIMK